VAETPAEGNEQHESHGAADGSTSTRGDFFAGAATIGVGGIMSAVIAVPALAFVLAPVFKTGSYDEVDLGPISNFPENSGHTYQTVTFESINGDTSGMGRRVAFIRNDGAGSDGKPTFTALSNTCMHLGCPVQSFGNAFGCPCHGGQYDSEGRRVAGPPVRPLNRYYTSISSNDHLILGQLHAVDEALKPFQLKGPGQPVTGWLSYLYPPAPVGQ
jgi:Rieske Fe-S protein